jgi:hypothetical protein
MSLTNYGEWKSEVDSIIVRRAQNVFDAGARGPDAQMHFELIEFLDGASRHELHASRREVTHPTLQLERTRVLPREPAESDSLNSPRYFKALSRHSKWLCVGEQCRKHRG